MNIQKRHKYVNSLKEAEQLRDENVGVIHKINKKYKMKSKYAVYW